MNTLKAEAPTLTAKRLPIANILLYLVFVVGLYFNMDLVIFNANPSTPFVPLEYMTVFFAFLALLILYFYVECRRSGFHPRPILLIGFLILFIISAAVILSAPSAQGFTAIKDGAPVSFFVLLSNERKIHDVLIAFVTLTLSYLFLDAVPRNFKFRKHFYFILIGMALTLAAYLLYSYIVEFDDYIFFFKNFMSPDIGAHAVKSFLNYKNNYAYVLFLMMFVFLYFHSVDGKWYHYLIVAFIYANIFFTLCKSVLLLGFLMVLFYLLGRFILTYKDHRKRNLITLSVVLAFLAALASLVIAVFAADHPLFVSVRNNFFFGGDNTLQNRLLIWSDTIAIMKQTSWLFGAGFGRFGQILLAFQAVNSTETAITPYAHNGYLQILGNGGILLLLVSLIYIGYLIYVLVRLRKTDKPLVILESVFLSMLLLYMIVEPLPPFFPVSVDYVLAAFFLGSPILARYYKMKHPIEDVGIAREAERAKGRKIRLARSPFDISRLIYFVATPIVAAFVAFSSTMFFVKGARPELALTTPYGIAAIAAVIAYAVLPYLIQLIYNRAKKIDKSCSRLGSYVVEEFLPYFISFAFLAGGMGAMVIYGDQSGFPDPHLLMDGSLTLGAFLGLVSTPAFVITLAMTFVYAAIFLLFRPLRAKTAFLVPILDRANDLFLRAWSLGIKGEKKPYDDPPPMPAKAKGRLRVLLIAPEFFYFAQSVEDEMRRRGCFVRRYDDRPSKKSWAKALIRIDRLLLARKSREYLEGIAYENANIPYDRVVVILGQSFTREMILALREEQPKAAYVYYLWDTVRNFRYSPRLAKAFDRAYAFEPGDVRKYPVFGYLPNFYGPEFRPKRNEGYAYDLSYVGTAWPRKMKDWKLLSGAIGNNLPERKIYFYLPSRLMYAWFKCFKKNYRGVRKKDLHVGRKLSKEDVLEVFYASRYVLDLPRDNQGGLTMRVLESMAAEKKLITTNKTVRDYDFYDPADVYVYEGGKIDFESGFFKEPFRPIPPEILRKYSLASFVKTLLG